MTPLPAHRILVARTDRIGDVVLSTPVIQALRQAYPQAFIAVVVSPECRQIVEGNPFLNEVIIYDKAGAQMGLAGTLRFVGRIKKKRFDVALILHPTNRMHLVAYLAGIPRRIGYDRKCAFLLTDTLRHAKQRGERHESDYTLDLVRYLGIEPHGVAPSVPVDPESERWAAGVLNGKGSLLVIHPGASCLSKQWPVERFAEVADRLVDKYSLYPVVIAGKADVALAEKVSARMKHRPLNLAGKTSVSQLASVFRRAAILISNDSGPVHIAACLGTAVVSIFGRNQPGLSPRRWGPLGARSRSLHVPSACPECLAHNCTKGFACLRAISVEDVYRAAEEFLRRPGGGG